MLSNPIVYQIFSSKDLALELTNLLSENNISFKTEVFNATFDSAFTNNSNKDYIVKINPNDFEKVDNLLLESMKYEIEDVNEDYYLFQFSNEELFDLIRKRDEWSQFDVLLAKKILQSKNIEFSLEQENKIKQERISELAEAKKAHIAYIVAGYIFCFFGGFIGLMIGSHLLISKKTLPNGNKVHEFDSESRKQGKFILILGLLGSTIAIILKVFRFTNTIS